MPTGAVLIDRIDAAYDPMSEWYEADHSTLELANEGTYVVSGCVVTPSSPQSGGTLGKLDMTAGVVMIGGTAYSASSVTASSTAISGLVSGSSVTSGKAMWVALEIDTSGALNFHAGSVTTVASTPPVKPAITASRVCVGWLYVYYDPNFSSPTIVDALTGTANGNAKLIEGAARCGNLYALLNGFAGGQTLKGDTASGGNLTLMSTAHATKGKVIVGSSAFDEANTRLGIGTTSPGSPLDLVATPTANSGSVTVMANSATFDATSATSTTAAFRGQMTSVATGNTATAFTTPGLVAAMQFLATHNSSTASVNLATLYGVLGAANLGGASQTLTPTVTNMYGGEFQAAQRSDLSGTVVSGEMTGVHTSVTSQARGTVALMAGFRAILTHLASSGGGSQSTTPPTTTLEIGYDLGFLFHSAGTIGTAIGLRLQAWPSGPTYTNGPYGLSVEGSTSLNWIRGALQLGGTTRPTTITPTSLYVVGTSQFDDDISVLGGKNIVLSATTGTKIGTATTQKLGFFNATPIVQGTAFTQTYSTASHTHAAVTATTAPAGGTGATAGAYDTAAHRDAMIASLTATQADLVNVKNVLNGLIDDLQALGLIA